MTPARNLQWRNACRSENRRRESFPLFRYSPDLEKGVLARSGAGCERGRPLGTGTGAAIPTDPVLFSHLKQNAVIASESREASRGDPEGTRTFSLRTGDRAGTGKESTVPAGIATLVVPPRSQ